MYTDVAIPVVSGHLYLGAKRKVKVIAASKGRLKVQQSLKTPIQQTFTTWASCSALTLTTTTPPGWNVPGHARGYVVKKDQITLYDDWHPDRSEVTALNRAPGSNGILLLERQAPRQLTSTSSTTARSRSTPGRARAT